MSKFLKLAFMAIFLMSNLNAKDSSIVQSEDTNLPEGLGVVHVALPLGWSLASMDTLPNSVIYAAMTKGKGAYPPSVHIVEEPFNGSLKDYLKIVKSINLRKGGEWKDLGKIKTKAGEGSLSQLEVKNQWGNVRMLHAIILKDGSIFIITASALKEEFPSYYKVFFEIMQSFTLEE